MDLPCWRKITNFAAKPPEISTLSTARDFKAAPIPLDKPEFTGTTAAAKGSQTVQSCIKPPQDFSRWKGVDGENELPTPPAGTPKKIRWHDVRIRKVLSVQALRWPLWSSKTLLQGLISRGDSNELRWRWGNLTLLPSHRQDSPISKQWNAVFNGKTLRHISTS